ncbi:MAG: hypothetical protein DRP58_10660 [Spirochaetes bacterium]|nr:MAG: hypothetical protein DRP58_10660 [Spirochaetota bacterium]
MELIKFFGKGPGFWVLLAILAVIFLGIALIVLKSSKKRYAGRILIPVFFIELALLFGTMALGFPHKGEVGPGVVPGLWIVGILTFSLLLFFQAISKHEEKDPPWGKISNVAVFILMTILYLIIMQFIGYYLATIIYLILGMYYLSYRNWKVMSSLTAGWVIFSYFAFYRLLYVPLPRGILIEWIFG